MVAKKTNNDEQAPIRLKPANFQTVSITVVGTAELIQHRFSEKARREMLAGMQKTNKAVKEDREPKDPEKDYLEARNILPDGREGITALSFKAAMVGACRSYPAITMVHAKTLLRVIGEGPEQLLPILDEDGNPAVSRMREDVTRVGQGKPDLRYRPGYWPWKVKVPVRFNADLIDLDSVVNLLNTSGEGGVGEWRPAAKMGMGGSYGTYEVETSDYGRMAIETN